MRGGRAELSGPSSVAGQLDKDRQAKGVVSVRADLLDEYFGFKKRVEEEHGFSFGFDYNALLQVASESPGEDIAAGGVFRAFGQWTLVGRDTGKEERLWVFGLRARIRF